MHDRRYRPSHLTAFAVSMFLAIGAAADSSYHIGNSLTYDMYMPGLEQIAESLGVHLDPGYHIRSSQSLVYMLNHPGDATLASPTIWPDALPAQPWNFVTFEPYPDGTSPSTLQSDITAAQTFIGLVDKSSNPAPVFFIYAAWPDQSRVLGDYDSYWNQPVSNSLDQRTVLARQYFDALFQRLTTQYGGSATIHVIPVGDVFARINLLIKSGQFQYADDIRDFYRDNDHMGSAGKFVAGITAFATMYRRNPAGAALTLYQTNEGQVPLNPEVAAELESIVWDVLTSDSARTGVYPITTSAASLSFPATGVGKSSQAQTVVVSNVTERPAPIDAIAVTPNYSVTHSCGNPIPPNSQCTVAVTLAPDAPGILPGELTIRAPGGPYTVSLSGSAPIDASISSDISAAMVGHSVTLTWNSTPGATCQAESDRPGSAWSGGVAASGSRTLTESTAGTVAYSLHCGASGVADVLPATSVIWSWQPVEVTLTATPTSVEVGQPISISWNSSAATDCNASGGGSGDGWSGAKATAGSQAITESVTTTGLTFAMSCSSSISGLSKSASVSVAQTAPRKSGGGGSWDFVSLAVIAIACFHRILRSRRTAVTASNRRCDRCPPSPPRGAVRCGQA